MRNLKKVLALVLALVMSLSLVTIANASDFADADDITYKEAVDVMTSIGVLEGVGNNTFNPGATLTREQAAKIICTMLLGENAEKLGTSTSSFTDVAASRWSAPYIEYCSSLGIVAGNGDGTFNPTGTLTGYAFAKMLLTALGYDAKIEGFTGTGWHLKVAAMSARTGILDNISNFAGTTSVSREQAAQMALNTLTAVKVEYVGNNVEVSGPDINVSVGNNRFSYVENLNNSTDGNMPDVSGNYDNADQHMQFGEMHFPSLVVRGTTDSFQRPASKWALDGAEIGTYADEATVTFTAETKEVDVKSAISGYSFATTAESYTNGYDGNVACTNAATLAALTGNGKLVQVYTNTLGQITKVIVVNSVLGKVISVDNAKEQIKIQTYATANLNSGNSATLTTTKGYGDVVRNDIVVLEYTTTTGDLSNTSSVSSVEKAEVVTGISNSVNTSKKTFSVDGTTYEQAANVDSAKDVTNFAVSATKNATLYLDSYGYVLRAEGASNADAKSMIVQSYYAALNDAGEIVYFIKGIDFNGETVSKQITKGDYDSATHIKGTVIEYFDDGTSTDTKANDGIYRLAAVTTAAKTLGSTNKKATTTIASTAKAIDGFYFSDDVKFIFGAVGANASDASVYEGIREVKTAADIYYVLGAEDASGNALITAVFVNAAATASTTDPAQIIFINGASIGDITVADTSVSSGYSKHDLYKGFVTGTEVEENVYAAVAEGTGVASGFYVISKKDANGAYILDSTTNYTADTGAYAVDGGNVASVGNDRYVTINGSTYDVGSALIVDTRELPANVSAVNSVAELSDLLGSNNVVAYVMFNADTNVAEYLYIDAVQAGGGLVSVNEPANNGAYGNLVSGDVAVVDDGFTTSQVSGMADNVKCLVFVFADANNGNSSKQYTLKISEAGKTDGAIYTDSGNISDTNKHQFYLAIDGYGYPNSGTGTMAGPSKTLPAGSYYFTITQGATVIESGYFEYAG